VLKIACHNRLDNKRAGLLMRGEIRDFQEIQLEGKTVFMVGRNDQAPLLYDVGKQKSLLIQ